VSVMYVYKFSVFLKSFNKLQASKDNIMIVSIMILLLSDRIRNEIFQYVIRYIGRGDE
jgi:hypothetical protein